MRLLQIIVFGLLAGGVYALMASGLTLVYGVMHIVNVAHGAMLILAATVTFLLWQRTGLDPLLGPLVTGPLLFAIGWLMYKLVLERLRNSPVTMTVLFTFGLSIVIEGALAYENNRFRAATPSYFNDSFELAGLALPQARVYGTIVAALVLGGMYFLLTRTWTGRAIRASAENRQGAQLIGIRVGAISALTFAVGAASAGAAGSILSVLYTFFPASHYLWISKLLAIVVLGGMGSLPGAVVGALILGVAESLVASWQPGFSVAVFYFAILVVLLIRPQGLMGRPARSDVAV